MKVVCESCQAKYQVPDERVAGKKLKIRCKRCGATVLIRGDLVQGAFERPSFPAESLAPVETAIPQAEQAELFEWHVSLDGDTRGPFDTDGVRAWLNGTPGGWEAHVWREGFPDWIEARACTELDPPPPAPSVTSLQDDELPTQTFQAHSFQGSQFMADVAGAPRGARSQPLSYPSAIRARSAAEPASLGSTMTGLGAAFASPRVSASQTLTGERNEDSVLFAAPSPQTMTGAPAVASAYVPGPNPGFANGEGSGLIDIRALASLARQGTTQIAAGGPKSTGMKSSATGSMSMDAALSFGNSEEDARIALAGQPSAFARIDSLAPVSNAPATSNVALPLAILGGCALVAAAVLAAVLFTRPSRPAEVVAVSVPSQTQDSVAAATQPPHEDALANAEKAANAAEPANREPSTAEATPEPTHDTSPAEPGLSDEELAAGKVKRKPSTTTRTAIEEKKNATTPEEKAKPKKEEKPEPSGTGEVMLADHAKPVKPAVSPTTAPEAAPPAAEPREAPKNSSASDLDSLLGAKPAPKPQPKSRSIDDLLSGAVEKSAPTPAPAAKPAAPAATAAPAAAASESSGDMPEMPSRDETLAAMRGVESAVRACNTGAEALTGTAEVALTVSGSTGRVTAANVTGITGNVGSCIARAVRNARFPRFTKPSFSIKYPFRF